MALLTIPTGIDEITPEWLTEVLRSRGNARRAAVASCVSEPIGEGKGFMGQVARLTLEYDGSGEDSPRTMIAKLPSKAPEIKALTALLGGYPREVRFYQEVAPWVGIETPRCHYGSVDPVRGHTVLLIQDMAPASAGDSVAGCSMDEARLSVRSLAGLHARWWDGGCLERMDWMPLKTDDSQAYQETYAQAWSMLVRKAGGCVPRSLADIAGRLEPHIPWIRERLSRHPRTIVHGDYRLDNLLFGARGGRPTVATVDWEFCTRGAGVYDLATFIVEAFPPEARRREETALLRLYHSALVEKGVRGYSYEQCLLDYGFSMLDLLVFWVVVGGHCDFGGERAARYLRNTLARFGAAMADHGSAELIPG